MLPHFHPTIERVDKRLSGFCVSCAAELGNLNIANVCINQENFSRNQHKIAETNSGNAFKRYRVFYGGGYSKGS